MEVESRSCSWVVEVLERCLDIYEVENGGLMSWMVDVFPWKVSRVFAGCPDAE